jgi:hypothetical protein
MNGVGSSSGSGVVAVTAMIIGFGGSSRGCCGRGGSCLSSLRHFDLRRIGV